MQYERKWRQKALAPPSISVDRGARAILGFHFYGNGCQVICTITL